MTVLSLITDYLSWTSRVSTWLVNLYIENARAMVDWLHTGFNSVFVVLLYAGIALSLTYIALSIFSAGYKERDDEPVSDEDAPTVAVHIPTMNELAALDCAEHCLESDYPEDKLTVIIGDDSDEEDKAERIKAFGEKHDRVHVIPRDDNEGYKPGNLNNMLDHTESELVCVFDSDFKPGPSFIRRLVTPLARDDDIHATQGRWEPFNAEQNYTTYLGTTITDVFDYVALPFVERLLGTVVLRGSAECLRRETLEDLGRWKSGSFTEDIEFSLRLLREGYTVEWVPSAKCDCELPFVPKDLYKQQMRWAYGVIKSVKTHGLPLLGNLFRGDTERRPLAGVTTTAILMLGYALSTILLGLLVFGTLSFITHPVGPLDLPRFLSETTTNIALTSGLIVITGLGMARANRLRLYPKSLLSMFSLGIITTLYVNNGIYRAIRNKSMQWFLLSKSGGKTHE